MRNVLFTLVKDVRQHPECRCPPCWTLQETSPCCSPQPGVMSYSSRASLVHRAGLAHHIGQHGGEPVSVTVVQSMLPVALYCRIDLVAGSVIVFWSVTFQMVCCRSTMCLFLPLRSNTLNMYLIFYPLTHKVSGKLKPSCLKWGLKRKINK